MARQELSLIERAAVTNAIADAHSKYNRFHDLYDGLTWRLCRDPAPEEAAEVAPETFLVKSESWNYAGFCVIFLVYTVDESENTIVVEDLWVEDVK